MRDALRFLTTLPVKPSSEPPAPPSVRWFPFAGLVVGFGWALFYAATNLYLGPFVAAAAVLVVDALLTGALHLDAFADVADGVASRRPPQEAIAIMRQPAIGAVGAGALILVCLLRVSVLVLVQFRAVTLLAVPVAGRAAMALVLSRIDARADGSLALAFHRPPRRATAEALGLAVALVLVPALSSTNPVPLAGLVCLAVALATAGAYAWWWRRRFGPITGDGVGAVGLIAETFALLVLGVQLDRV